MRAYKHLHLEALPHILKGSMRLTRLRDLSQQELGDLSDEGEGSLRFSANGPIFVDVNNTSSQQIVTNLKGIVSFEGAAVISNIVFDRPTTDYWVLCLSESPTRLGGYNATVEVSDVERLAEAIQRRHPLHLGRWQSAHVRYVGRDVDVRDWRRDLDPFRKPVAYEHEREIRIIWELGLPQPSPFVTGSDRAVADFLRRMY